MAAIALGAGVVAATTGPAADAQLPPIGGGQTTPTQTSPTTTVPPNEAPPVVAPAPLGDATTHAGADGTRRGAIADGGLKPPLRSLWRQDFDALVSRVVVGEGRAYVISGGRVTALDLATGARRWTSAVQGAGELAFGGGRVFVSGSIGLTALDAASGTPVWTSAQGSAYGAPPLVAGDLVILQGQGLTAFDAATGAQRWKGGTSDGSEGAPAVAGDRVFQYGGCTIVAVDRRTGRVIWSRNSGCTGGGGGTVLVERDRVHSAFGAAPMQAADGADVAGARVQIAAGDIGLQGQDGLTAVDLASSRVLWRVKPDESFPNDALGAPLVVGDQVLQTRFEGTVQARSLRTGAITWQAKLRRARETFTGSDSASDFALGAGGGVLVVLRGSTVDGLGPAGASPPRSIALTVPRRRAFDAYDAVPVRGRVTGDLLPTVRIEVDPYPRGGFKTAGRRLVADDKGRLTGAFRPDRNTRVRLTGLAGSAAPTQAYTVYVYPRIRFRLTNVVNRITARISVRGSRAIRYRGRRVHLYLVRVGQRRLVRLGSARLRGPRRRSGSGVVRFAALTKVGRRDFLLACVPGVQRLGQGAADVVQRRCGRATIRY